MRKINNFVVFVVCDRANGPAQCRLPLAEPWHQIRQLFCGPGRAGLGHTFWGPGRFRALYFNLRAGPGPGLYNCCGPGLGLKSHLRTGLGPKFQARTGS